MRSTFRVLFYVKKGSEKPNGNLPLMCRITVDGEIKQLSLSFINDFEYFLRTEKKCRTNTIWGYMIVLKHIISIVRNDGRLLFNPFAGYINSPESVDRGQIHAMMTPRCQTRHTTIMLQGIRQLPLYSYPTEYLLRPSADFWDTQTLKRPKSMQK